MSGEAVRILRLAVLGSISILPLLILPTMVGALVDYAGFSEPQAGWAAAVGAAGSALTAIAIAGLVLLNNFSGTAAYTIAMCALSIAWAFGLPFFQAFEARLDSGGSVVVAGGFFTSAGAALGPALAAVLVALGDYSGVLVASIAVYLVVGILMLATGRLAAGNKGAR